jgi:hypothetical protein
MYDSPILKQETLSLLQSSIERTGGYCETGCLLNVESPWTILLLYTIPDDRNSMFEPCAGHGNALIFIDEPFIYGHDLQLVRKCCIGMAKRALNKFYKSRGSVHLDLPYIPCKTTGGKQPGHTINMISMEMRNEDFRYPADMKIAAKELMLCPFSAVEQPQARLLFQPQSQR